VLRLARLSRWVKERLARASGSEFKVEDADAERIGRHTVGGFTRRPQLSR